MNHFAILDVGTPELIIILVIILLLFGSKKLPELSKSLGDSIKTLRKSMDDSSEVNAQKQKDTQN